MSCKIVYGMQRKLSSCHGMCSWWFHQCGQNTFPCLPSSHFISRAFHHWMACCQCDSYSSIKRQPSTWSNAHSSTGFEVMDWDMYPSGSVATAKVMPNVTLRLAEEGSDCCQFHYITRTSGTSFHEYDALAEVPLDNNSIIYWNLYGDSQSH